MTTPGPRSTLLAIPKMDCPSEERLVRMALDGLDDVDELGFDLQQRTLSVTHRGDPGLVLAKLEPLGLGARVVDSGEAGPAAPAAPEARDEAGALRLLLGINGTLFLVEIVAGWLAQSTGLIADSLDMLADAFVYVLSQSDGLPSEQCMLGFNAGLRTRGGLLHFSTSRGIVVVNPTQPRTNSSAPAVWLEKVLVDGAVYHARIQPGSVPTAPAGKAGELAPRENLKLPPGKRRLEFIYTGLSLGAPENVRFRYRLEGLDDRWFEAGKERSVSYSLLPAGRYRFHVTACDNPGIWNDQGASMAFEVEPFFWQTLWFRLGLLGVLAASLVATVRYISFRRLRLRLHRLEQEAAVQKERARIAKDLHDDLGAHLSQIAMLSELAQSDLHKPEQAHGHIDLIFRTARSVTRALDEIVWAVNPRNDSLDRFAAHICTFAPEFLRAAGVSCRLDVPMDLPTIVLRANVRHHLYLAFKEALNNVVKHAGATEVWLRLQMGEGELSLVIEDNGRGFSPGTGGAPGEDGLANLRQRMGEIGGRFEQLSEPGQGTRTRLVAPLESEVV